MLSGHLLPLLLLLVFLPAARAFVPSSHRLHLALARDRVGGHLSHMRAREGTQASSGG